MKSLYRVLTRISNRLLAFNLLLVFLPIIGVLSLETYEDELLRLQERSMVQQARILAAALGTEANLDSERAQRVLVNLDQRVDARLRIYDAAQEVVADSSRLGPRREDVADEAAQTVTPEARESYLYRLGSFLYRLYARGFLPPEVPSLDSDLGATALSARGQALEKAFSGRYGQAFRSSPTSRSLILYSAIPIRHGPGAEAEIIGAVLVTKSTYGILTALYDLRLATFKVVLTSVAAAIILSLLVSTTIVRPLQRLQREASAMLDRRGRLRGRFRASERSDEIGDLSRSLAELTRRLEGHIRFIESFASDVSHEFKNPLAAIRSATELLSEVDEPEQRQRFLGMILDDIARLEHLLSSVREITQIDAQLEEQDIAALTLAPLLEGLIERFELQHGEQVRFDLHIDDPSLEVQVDADRLAQVFENLLDNAVSFSPPGSRIEVRLEAAPKVAKVWIRDQGCGVPTEHRQRIFDRFFSYRPDAPHGSPARGGQGRHPGLGLAIVRAIVEGFGGSVELADAPPSQRPPQTPSENRPSDDRPSNQPQVVTPATASPSPGATFVVTLPRAT